MKEKKGKHVEVQDHIGEEIKVVNSNWIDSDKLERESSDCTGAQCCKSSETKNVSRYSPELKFTKVRDVKSPTRAHSTDCGIDFFVPNDFKEAAIPPGKQILIPSGIKVAIPQGYCLLGVDKSGVATKKSLLVGAKLIDTAYSGEVHINLHNVSGMIQRIKPGEKIVQFMLLPVSYLMPTEVSEEEYTKLTEDFDRKEKGFGATGNQ